MDATIQLPLFSLSGQRVLIMGLGESGLAMARWASLQQAAQIEVFDTREQPAQLEALAKLAPHALFSHVQLEGLQASELQSQFDLVAWSPGLSIEVGPSASFYQALVNQGMRVVGESELFAQALAGMREQGYAPKLIAITGTNGKTTTTQLVKHLCEAAGLRTQAAGNISPAALDALSNALINDLWPEVWVLELSSFQLALTQSLQADAACILNISQDHLDWHGSMETYIAAKRRIHPQQGVIVINRLDSQTWPASLPDWPPVQALNTKSSRRRARDSAPAVIEPQIQSFGLDVPEHGGDFGRVQLGGLMWLTHANRFDDTLIEQQRLMPADALLVRGAHNHANALAAMALARAIGVPLAKMLHGLRSFAGDAHRCELVARIDEVEYYDDSKGTNVGATVAALQGIGRPSVLIVGGDGKGQDFAPLAQAIAKQARDTQAPLRAVVQIGRDGPAIAALVQQALTEIATELPIVRAQSMEEAVTLAREHALSGDAVLMSPACASFDMFRNYAHRAEVFVAAVQALRVEFAA